MPDPTQLRPGANTHVVASVRAEVIDGPDRGRHATASDALSVGTAKDNTLVVADVTVSGFHLELAVHPGGIAITDLGSTNGTYLGSARIERAIVAPGTTLKLGGTTIRC